MAMAIQMTMVMMMGARGGDDFFLRATRHGGSVIQ